MAASERTRKRGAIGEPRAIQTFFSYRLLDPENVRNRPPGGGGIYDIGCYAILTARYIFGAEPTRVVATLDRDPNFHTDRLTSAIFEFPGGRHVTFSVATQLSAHQRVTIVGEAGRIEVMIPFNSPPDRPREIVIDSGADLIGGGRRIEQFAVCDQYTLQGDAFSRAVQARRRSNSRSRTPSPTCASSTPCFARRKSGLVGDPLTVISIFIVLYRRCRRAPAARDGKDRNAERQNKGAQRIVKD